MKKLLISCLIGNDSKIFNMVMKYFSLSDILKITSRLIGTGNIGGKSIGMLLATQILTSLDDTKTTSNLYSKDTIHFLSALIFIILI